ncbi:MAG: DUF3990 domain-containing protein [Oscillospiraceae bacterium]|nr:DUF3990 domain-containing protein [Oscillospiraceae bacterium]
MLQRLTTRQLNLFLHLSGKRKELNISLKIIQLTMGLLIHIDFIAYPTYQSITSKTLTQNGCISLLKIEKKNTFPEILSKYNSFDIIGGKIADDQTARTLQLYTSGGYGTVGTAKADNLALEVLLPDKLQDQFCFKSEKALKCLEFVKSDRYGNVKK